MSKASVFDFFKSEATYDDVVVRTEAMLKLPLILANMEAVEIREQLVPFLQSKTNPEEPEQEQVLVAMAKHLGSILPYMDGMQHASLLVPIFEELFGKEESYIRDYAAKSCGTVLGSLDVIECAPLLLPQCVLRFFRGSTRRSSTTAALHAVFEFVARRCCLSHSHTASEASGRWRTWPTSIIGRWWTVRDRCTASW